MIVGREKEMGLVYGAEHLLRMLGMFSFFLRLFLVCFYHKTDLSPVIVVFPMTITNAELDDGSVQMLRDSIDELLLCVFPLLYAVSITQHRDNIGTWNTKGKTYFSRISKRKFTEFMCFEAIVCVLPVQCLRMTDALALSQSTA